ncbi:hypothetical protein NEPAR06_2417, partial [Nematocida parisii]
MNIRGTRLSIKLWFTAICMCFIVTGRVYAMDDKELKLKYSGLDHNKVEELENKPKDKLKHELEVKKTEVNLIKDLLNMPSGSEDTDDSMQESMPSGSEDNDDSMQELIGSGSGDNENMSELMGSASEDNEDADKKKPNALENGSAEPTGQTPADGESKPIGQTPADGESKPIGQTPADESTKTSEQTPADGELKPIGQDTSDTSTGQTPADGELKPIGQDTSDTSTGQTPADGELKPIGQTPADESTKTSKQPPADGESEPIGQTPADGESEPIGQTPADESTKTSEQPPADGESEPIGQDGSSEQTSADAESNHTGQDKPAESDDEPTKLAESDKPTEQTLADGESNHTGQDGSTKPTEQDKPTEQTSADGQSDSKSKPIGQDDESTKPTGQTPTEPVKPADESTETAQTKPADESTETDKPTAQALTGQNGPTKSDDESTKSDELAEPVKPADESTESTPAATESDKQDDLSTPTKMEESNLSGQDGSSKSTEPAAADNSTDKDDSAKPAKPPATADDDNATKPADDLDDPAKLVTPADDSTKLDDADDSTKLDDADSSTKPAEDDSTDKDDQSTKSDDSNKLVTAEDDSTKQDESANPAEPDDSDDPAKPAATADGPANPDDSDDPAKPAAEADDSDDPAKPAQPPTAAKPITAAKPPTADNSTNPDDSDKYTKRIITTVPLTGQLLPPGYDDSIKSDELVSAYDDDRVSSSESTPAIDAPEGSPADITPADVLAELNLVNNMQCMAKSNIHIWSLPIEIEEIITQEISHPVGVTVSDNKGLAQFLIKHNSHIFRTPPNELSDELFTQCIIRTTSLTIDTSVYEEGDLSVQYNWSLFKNLMGFEIMNISENEHSKKIENILTGIKEINESVGMKHILVLSNMSITSGIAQKLVEMKPVQLGFNNVNYSDFLEESLDEFIGKLSDELYSLTLCKFTYECSDKLGSNSVEIFSIYRVYVESCTEEVIESLFSCDFYRLATTHIYKTNQLSNLDMYTKCPFLYVRNIVLIDEGAISDISSHVLSKTLSIDSICVVGGSLSLSIDGDVFNPKITKIRELGIESRCKLSITGTIESAWLSSVKLSEYIYTPGKAIQRVFKVCINEYVSACVLDINRSSLFLNYSDCFMFSPVLDCVDKSGQFKGFIKIKHASSSDEGNLSEIQSKAVKMCESSGLNLLFEP